MTPHGTGAPTSTAAILGAFAQLRPVSPALIMIVVLLKVGLALAIGLLGAWVLRTRIMDLPERQFRLTAVALQLVPALLVFAALYVVGHQEPTSDVPSYYIPAARSTLAGKLPFRDFMVSYAPGFPYVGAALTWVWNSGKVFALFAILLNAVALMWWHAAAGAHFTSRAARESTVLFATSGHVLVQALLGTNQAWVGAGLAASTLLMSRGHETGAGLAQAATACTTKVLAHLFWPLFWICAQHRWRWLLAAAAPTALLYCVFVTVGAGDGLLYPLRFEGNLISPGNLPYLLDLLLGAAGHLERTMDDGMALLALAAATGWLYLKARALPPRDRHTLLLAGLAFTGLVFMLFSKKSFTGYLLFVMYPIVLTLVANTTAARARVGFMLCFNSLLVAEPTLWFRLQGDNISLRAWLATGSTTAVVGFVLLDVALVACYVYLGWLSARGVERIAAGAMAATNASQSATACSLV